MLFKKDITIPKNTTKGSPVEVILPIAHGIITKIMVRPRPGHAALAHLVILHHEHQIAPSNPEADLAGDTFPIDWEEYYESYEPAYELKLRGWNDDDTYPHSFTVHVAVLPRKAIVALSVVDAMKAALVKTIPKVIPIPSWLKTIGGVASG